jgi:hypothetical protein
MSGLGKCPAGTGVPADTAGKLRLLIADDHGLIRAGPTRRDRKAGPEPDRALPGESRQARKIGVTLARLYAGNGRKSAIGGDEQRLGLRVPLLRDQ